jgi:DNA-binding NarL/FixJ family response regulator
LLSAIKLHVSSWGYAFFLTVNATSTWGGIFPFLPVEFQTAEVTLVFFLSQALAFWLAFALSLLGSYFLPAEARRMLVSLSALLVFAGSACLIGAMYLPGITLLLVAGGGILLGIGCAGLFMLWQRYFASLASQAGSLRLILGTAIAPIIYLALYFIPIALTAFLVPLVFVPLCALSVSLSISEMRIDQPMFEDIPRQHPRVYRQVVKEYWRSAICVGSLAFASGVIRGIALLHQDLSTFVNIVSMIGLFFAAVVLLAFWSRFGLRIGLPTVFRVVYPLVITGFLLLPFLGNAFLNPFAAFTYMVFSFVLMLMMMQCAQISRDRGINPIFIYAFFGSIVYLPQGLGFLFGWLSDSILMADSEKIFTLALVPSYILGLTLLAASGTLLKNLTGKAASIAEPIEVIPLKRDTGLPTLAASWQMAAEQHPPKARRNRPSPSEEPGAIQDRLSKKCLILKEQYELSSRETEVAEQIARGNSVKTIAEKLFISENTVRTHSKNIYSKLAIHKRQDLLDILEQVNLFVAQT